MKTYEFKIILNDVPELTDDQGDALFVAGCDDGTIISRDGKTFIHFSRDSASLEDAINSATSAVQGIGFQVAHVEVHSPV